MLRPILSSAITLVDFIKADAGHVESQFEARVSALYTAYFHILKSGNKTQWNLVETQFATFNSAKACGVLVGTPDRASPKAKRAFEVMGAYASALKHVGIPAVMKDASKEQMETVAADLAYQFATMVQVSLTPEEKPVVSKEEKDAIKAEKAAEKVAAQKAADKALKAKIREEAAKLVDAASMADKLLKEEAAKLVDATSNAPTMADMVRMVAAAARAGALDAEALALLDGALDSRAIVEFEIPANGDVVAVETTVAA